jgi:uncharacterized membrane protein
MVSSNNNLIKYSLLLLLILGWTLNPFMKRKSMGTLNSFEYFVVNFILTCIIAALYWGYLIKTGQCDLNVFHKMKTVEIYWALGAAFLSVLTGIILMYLIKEYQVSHIIPQIQPGVILLTVLFGVLLFNESLNRYKWAGIFSIILGMILMNIETTVDVGKRPWK